MDESELVVWYTVELKETLNILIVLSVEMQSLK